MPLTEYTRNPSGPVGLPRTLDPRRIGTEGPRFGIPGSSNLTGVCEYVKAQLSGLRLNCPNTGYPNGPGTKPSYDPASDSLVIAAPPVGYIFRVTLRFRGVLERSGVNSPITTLAGGKVAVGGTVVTLAGQYFRFSFTDGGGTHYLNYKSGATIDPIESLDYTFTADLAETETEVGLSLRGGTSFYQRDNTVEQVVGPPGIEPYPDYYPGQFGQIDCTSCVLVEAP